MPRDSQDVLKCVQPGEKAPSALPLQLRIFSHYMHQSEYFCKCCLIRLIICDQKHIPEEFCPLRIGLQTQSPKRFGSACGCGMFPSVLQLFDHSTGVIFRLVCRIVILPVPLRKCLEIGLNGV